MKVKHLKKALKGLDPQAEVIFISSEVGIEVDFKFFEFLESANMEEVYVREDERLWDQKSYEEKLRTFEYEDQYSFKRSTQIKKCLVIRGHQNSWLWNHNQEGRR